MSDTSNAMHDRRRDPLDALPIAWYRPQWHRRAACRGSDIDFTSRVGTVIAEALQLCGRCDVRRECLDEALDLDDRFAVRGGMTPAARRRLARRDTTEEAS